MLARDHLFEERLEHRLVRPAALVPFERRQPLVRDGDERRAVLGLELAERGRLVRAQMFEDDCGSPGSASKIAGWTVRFGAPRTPDESGPDPMMDGVVVNFAKDQDAAAVHHRGDDSGRQVNRSTITRIGARRRKDHAADERMRGRSVSGGNSVEGLSRRRRCHAVLRCGRSRAIGCRCDPRDREHQRDDDRRPHEFLVAEIVSTTYRAAPRPPLGSPQRLAIRHMKAWRSGSPGHESEGASKNGGR